MSMVLISKIENQIREWNDFSNTEITGTDFALLCTDMECSWGRTVSIKRGAQLTDPGANKPRTVAVSRTLPFASGCVGSDF